MGSNFDLTEEEDRRQLCAMLGKGLGADLNSGEKRRKGAKPRRAHEEDQVVEAMGRYDGSSSIVFWRISEDQTARAQDGVDR